MPYIKSPLRLEQGSPNMRNGF
uniref:Uncharacterized protein n=1 Tax=Arundo donax TaxID=35708 RepID=A0A0A8ZEF4_ARUDO